MTFRVLAVVVLLITLPQNEGLAQRLGPSYGWMGDLLNSDNLDTTDLRPILLKQDLAHLWISKFQESTIGFIGNNYQRFDIHFTAASKDSKRPSLYHVQGKTRVKSQICAFKGIFRIIALRRWKESEVDSITQGVVALRYELREDPKQAHAGLLEGFSQVNWYMDSRNILIYDDLSVEADGYSNNEFVGTWKSYSKDAELPCNWGDFRIPLSGDLDRGVGEFHPADKYRASGWENYSRESGRVWWK